MIIIISKVNEATIKYMRFVAKSDDNHTGVGRNKEEAIGDLIMSYDPLTKLEDGKWIFEITEIK